MSTEQLERLLAQKDEELQEAKAILHRIMRRREDPDGGLKSALDDATEWLEDHPYIPRA